MAHAVYLYRTGRVRALIMTGGPSPGERVSNAEAGRDYAIARGVPPADIVIEPFSRNTQQNLAYASRLAAARGWRSVLIVTDPPHIKRSLRLAHAQGLRAYPAPTPLTPYRDWRSRLWFWRRETCALVATETRLVWERLVAAIYGPRAERSNTALPTLLQRLAALPPSPHVVVSDQNPFPETPEPHPVPAVVQRLPDEGSEPRLARTLNPGTTQPLQQYLNGDGALEQYGELIKCSRPVRFRLASCTVGADDAPAVAMRIEVTL